MPMQVCVYEHMYYAGTCICMEACTYVYEYISCVCVWFFFSYTKGIPGESAQTEGDENHSE
jgi:hypothetical protein